LTGRSGLGCEGRLEAIFDTGARVSIAVELETDVTRSREYRFESLRYGLVSMSGFLSI